MDWSILLSLICPIMMLFCMKGMFSGHNHQRGKCVDEQSVLPQEDIKSLHAKMVELAEQNSFLVKEVQSLKETVTVLKAANEQN